MGIPPTKQIRKGEIDYRDTIQHHVQEPLHPTAHLQGLSTIQQKIVRIFLNSVTVNDVRGAKPLPIADEVLKLPRA